MGDDNDIDMALVTRHFNFILFLKNKAIAKIGEKRSEKPQCYDVRVLVTWGMSVQTRKKRKKKKKMQKKYQKSPWKMDEKVQKNS